MTPMRTHGVTLGRCATVLAIAAIWAAAAGGAGAAPPAGPRIAIQGFAFSPTPLKVKVGATVTWINKDDEPHTVVSATGSFRSSAIDTEETFEHRFDTPDTYHFLCILHPTMMGTVVVE